MKFLFILADKHPLFRVDLTVLFAKHIKEKGYIIDWIMPSTETNFFNKVLWDGGTGYLAAKIQIKSFFGKLLNNIFVVINSLRAIFLFISNKYDFVQIKDQYLPALFFIPLCKFKKVPIFFWSSYPFPESYIASHRLLLDDKPRLSLTRGKILECITYKYICPKVDHIFVQSSQMYQDMAEKGVAQHKMTVVPMGFDRDMMSAIQDEPGLVLGEYSLVFTGIFFRIRRLEFLFDVLEIVRKTIPLTTLHLVGEAETPEYEKELLDLIEQKGLQDSIIITGFLPHNEMIRYVKSSSLCLSVYFPIPVLNSTSPTKLIEYMAMGKPSVVTEHPEQQLLISESQGGICTPYDAQKMADAIVYLLQNNDIAKKMGENAQKYIFTKRSYKVISDMLDAKYTELTSKDA